MVCLGNDGIVRLSYRQGAVVDDTDARAIMSVVNSACQGRRRPLLVDLSGLESVSRAARRVFAIRSRVAGMALFGTSPVECVIATFFMRFHPMPCPAAYFAKRSAALQWLHSVGRGSTASRREK